MATRRAPPATARGLDAVIAFAETRKCRTAQVLTYFGESTFGPCRRCDVC